MKRMSLRTAVGFALILVLMLTAAPVAASSQDKGSDGQARGAMLAQGGEDQGLLIVAPQDVHTGVIPPDKLWVPVYVTVPLGADPASLEAVSVESAERVTRLDAPASLEPQEVTSQGVIAALSDVSSDPEVIGKGKYVLVEVDLTGLSLKEGDRLPLTVSAWGSNGQRRVESSVALTYSVQSLPSLPGWYAGDGHIHTKWSDGNVELDGQTQLAISEGLKWIVITDHVDGIKDSPGEWLAYVSACNESQFIRGIPVMPGFECTALDSDSGSDALGYACSETNPGLPPNQALSPQLLIDAINAYNPGVSYSVIAHPYNSSVLGFRPLH